MVLKESNFWNCIRIVLEMRRMFVASIYIYIYINDRLKEKFEYI